MEFSLWLALVGAGAMISLTPGAGAINTMSNALTAGFRRAIWGILGQQLALIIQIVIVAAGVGLLVSSSPLAFHIIRYAGAAYLVYLGIRKLLAKADTSAEDSTGRVREARRSMFLRGLWVNLLNPKAIVFFLAFMPQFIRPQEPLAQQYVVLTATVVLIDVVVMWLIFAAGAKQLQHLTASERGQLTLNRIFGLLFIAVGALLVVL
ncbi:MAG: LysE family transporter [Actinomycetota bacterium]|uniref:LysE family transporter n=1 Tax=Micrococcaceae TaxID=1268 RepID=UPI0024BAA2BB|nr:LysE family transporter [Paenarthrobacter sp. PH39-S1]MDJ0354778.1 LysE family transporter [Paenarthrobacter sp. PH39-S1]MDQ6739232.1 LysE family transporter [Actinomycetota bacterium]